MLVSDEPLNVPKNKVPLTVLFVIVPSLNVEPLTTTLTYVAPTPPLPRMVTPAEIVPLSM